MPGCACSSFIRECNYGVYTMCNDIMVVYNSLSFTLYSISGGIYVSTACPLQVYRKVWKIGGYD